MFSGSDDMLSELASVTCTALVIGPSVLVRDLYYLHLQDTREDFAGSLILI